MNWKEFWNEFPDKFQKDAFFHQVGKTYQSNALTEDQLRSIVVDVKNKINLLATDIVLDLCCGNGLITDRVAKSCKAVVGVDFSVPLIEIAKEYHNAHNLKYLPCDALEINESILYDKLRFTKIYMYEALQHFEENELLPLLNKLFSISDTNVVILLTSILDKEKIQAFYHTPELLNDYYEKKNKGELLLGTWWDKKKIDQICIENNLKCEFLNQPESFHTAYYRFDVRITKK